jgi:type VI secretion system secreted protein VgrG
LAYSGITNTGATVITGGNIGSYPTTTITGITAGNFVSPATTDNTNASAAQTALAAAITYYQGVTPTLSGLSNLSTGGNGSTASTYTPGNYFSVAASSLTMPTGIILDAQGNPNAVFVFVAGSTINLASGQTVALVNGAVAANVVFVAGSSFTSVATSTMNGNILAVASITLGGGVQNGRALANTGAVTISAATTVTVVNSINTSTGEVPAGTNLSAELAQISGYCGEY